MSEIETKHLRKKLNAYYSWMAEEINLGHMDLERAPECFDKKQYLLDKEIQDDRTIGSHCHYCKKKFEEKEAKSTDNHIVFFHHKCKEDHDSGILKQ